MQRKIKAFLKKFFANYRMPCPHCEGMVELIICDFALKVYACIRCGMEMKEKEFLRHAREQPTILP